MSLEPTTPSLLQAALDGDQSAWGMLVDEHRSLVWSVVRGAGLDGPDADDTFQVTFIRLLERGRSIRDSDRLAAWLATTARNEAMSTHRRRRRTRPVDDLDEMADVESLALDGRVLTRETIAGVRLALEELRDGCRELLRLLFADPPPSYKLVSETLGMPIGSIGPTRQRCLDELRGSPHLRGLR